MTGNYKAAVCQVLFVYFWLLSFKQTDLTESGVFILTCGVFNVSLNSQYPNLSEISPTSSSLPLSIVQILLTFVDDHRPVEKTLSQHFFFFCFHRRGLKKTPLNGALFLFFLLSRSMALPDSQCPFADATVIVS